MYKYMNQNICSKIHVAKYLYNLYDSRLALEPL